MLPTKLVPLGIAVLTSSIFTVSAVADSIGVNFTGPTTSGNGAGSDANDVRALDPVVVAGVIPASNWNNGDGATGGLEALVNDVGGIGTPTTAAVSWTSNATWTAHNTPGGSSGDQILTNGYIDDTSEGLNNPSIPTTISFTGIPFVGAYDVYLYFGSDGNNRTGLATLGNTVINFATNTNPFDGTYTAATPEDDGAADDGEYALFSGVSGADFSITVERGSDNVGVHGVQIVGAIPEPATFGLLSIGVLGLVSRRRRSA